jgi:uncharacterized membrane protein (UPF0127 family)
MSWLLRDGDVLATVEVADGWRARTRGLLGRNGIEGALVLLPCRQVHTFGVRFPIDVAFCRRDGRVLRTVSLRPWRICRPVPRAAFAVEAEAGAFDRWRLAPGDVVEVTGLFGDDPSAGAPAEGAPSG